MCNNNSVEIQISNREVHTMSPKELLYLEDALSHEQQLKKSCSDFANQIQDPELKSFLQTLSSRHQESFSRFLSVLN